MGPPLAVLKVANGEIVMRRCLTWMLVVMNFSLFAQGKKADLSIEDRFGAVEYLPSDCAVVVVVANMEKLWEKLGAKDLVREYDKPYREMAQQMESAFGINPFPPEKLHEKGLDPSRPMGFALLQGSYVRVLFLNISNAARFQRYKSWLVEQKKWRQHKLISRHNIEVLSYGPIIPDGVVIVHGNRYLLSFSFPPGFFGDRGKMMREWAKLGKDREASLGRDACFRKTVEPLPPTADVTAYLDLSPLARQHLEPQNNIREQGLSESQRIVKSLPRDGDPAILAYWKKIAAMEKNWIQRYQERKSMQVKLQREILEPLSISAFSVQVDKVALQLDWHFQLNEKSVLARGLWGGRPSLLKAPQSPPLCLITCFIHSEVIDELRKRDMDFAKAMVHIDECFRHVTKIDAEEIVPLLTGEIGMLFHGDIKPQRQVDVEKVVHGSVVACIKPEEREKAGGISERLAARLESLNVGKMDRGSGWFTVNIPDASPAHFTLHDGWWVLTNDGDFRRDLRSDDKKPLLFRYPERLQKFLSGYPVCFLLILEVRDLMCLGLSAGGYFADDIPEGKIIMKIAERLGTFSLLVEKQPRAIIIHAFQIIKEGNMRDFIAKTIRDCRELQRIAEKRDY